MRKAAYIGCDPGSDPGKNALARQQAFDGQLKERPVGRVRVSMPGTCYSPEEFADRMDSFSSWAVRHPGSPELARRLAEVSRLAEESPEMFSEYSAARGGLGSGPLALVEACMPATAVSPTI